MTTHELTHVGPPGHFYECPRWRDDTWWYSDVSGGAIYRMEPGQEPTVFARLGDDEPGGLVWSADGNLCAVAKKTKRLLRFAPDGGISGETDLASLCEIDGFLNDAITGPRGNLYIGFDADYVRYGPGGELGTLLHVAPDGTANVVATELDMPNGMAVSPDGKTLIVAETWQPRISAYAIREDGSLGPREIWTELKPMRDERANRSLKVGGGPIHFDGMDLDTDGFVWVADVSSGCLRVGPGGRIVDSITLPEGLQPFACALGGKDGRTLLICAADDNYGNRTERNSHLYTTHVEVPRA